MKITCKDENAKMTGRENSEKRKVGGIKGTNLRKLRWEKKFLNKEKTKTIEKYKDANNFILDIMEGEGRHR